MRFDGTVYVRVGPSSRRATAGEEHQLVERRQRIDLPFDQRAVPEASVDDLDLDLFRSTYLPSAVSPAVLEENGRSEVHQLQSLRFLTPEGVPTVAGVVVLGLDPTAYLSGAYVQFARYDGSDADAPVLDQDELRGNLVNQLTDLNSRIPANIRHALTSDGFREEEIPDYPLQALREAIVNALVHRSYESRSPVRILWFSDRVEILNPGGPFGAVTTQNFETSTDYRNPTLAEAAKNLGYMNRFGRGIARIRLALARNGNAPPTFDIEGTYWSVTIRSRDQ
jgi:ATP-dependent DNA helicase RecG